MKIVLIDKEEGLKIGGISVYSQRFYHYLISHGHEVYILRYAKKKHKEKYILHLPYYLAEPRSFIFLPTERTLSIIKKHLKKINPDIVYTSVGLSPLDFFLPSLCRELNIPLAGIWHADFNYNLSSYQILTKSLFLAYLPFCQQLDLLHVFSDKLGKFYIRRGIDKDRILVLSNGVDPDIYKPKDSLFAKHKNIKRGILFLGRLTMQKNPEVLLTTFLKLNPPKDTKLVLVGHGDQEERLRQEYQDRRIIFTGAVKDEKQKIDIMNACQIFVQPSRFEGMSLALLEAMSCQLAIITTDAGANGEVATGAGIVIPTDEIKNQLPLALEICFENEDFMESLGKKARIKILKSYSQEVIFDKLTSVLLKTIENYKRYGPKKSKPIDINLFLKKRIDLILDQIKKMGSTLTDIS